MNAAVLVSGGTGFVGRFIVEDLLQAGYRVTVMGRAAPADGFFSAAVSFIPGQLDPDSDWRAAFAGMGAFVHASFDHLPGRYRGGEGADPVGFRRRNEEGSIRLFEAARAAGVGRAVFLSSRAVYGVQPPGAALDEAMEPRPDTLYGEVKLAVERHLARLSDDPVFAGVSLRITGVYGPAGAGRLHKWTGLFDDYVAGRPITPRAGTEVHGQDVALAVRLMLEAEPQRVSGEVFNISDLLVDRHDLLRLVQAETGCRHPLPPQADKSVINAMTCDRVAALGWRPAGRLLLERTVRELVREMGL